MCRKTVLRSLLNSGYAPLSNEVKSMLDREAESGEGDAIDLGNDIVNPYPVDESTGEVIDVTPQEAENELEEPVKEDPSEEPKKSAKRGRPRKRLQEMDEEMEDEAVESFFDEVGAV